MDIASTIGVSAQEVLDALRVMGEYVDSPKKRIIEEPVKKRVCDLLGKDYTPPTISVLPSWQRNDQGGPGKDLPKRGRPSSAGPQDSGTRTLLPPDQSLGLGNPADDASVTMADFEWTYYGFSATERDAWRQYLRWGQAKYAAHLRDAGFGPEDLMTELHGWTVYKRLREGESIAQVKRLLERHRHSEAG